MILAIFICVYFVVLLMTAVASFVFALVEPGAELRSIRLWIVLPTIPLFFYAGKFFGKSL